MSTELIPKFHDTEFQIVDASGEKWVAQKQLAKALGLSNYKALYNLINRNPNEFNGKTGVFTMDTPGGKQLVRTLSYHGVIRAAMLSDAPRAVEFRDWAETVLFKVMTRGHYIEPRISDSIVKDVIADVVHAVVVPLIESQERRFKAELDQRFSKVLVPANPDVTGWPTPTQRLRALGIGCPLPGRFNSGGRFDLYFADEHYKELGGYPHIRCRRYIGKRPEYVISIDPQTDDLLRRSFKKYMRDEWKQESMSFLS